MVQKPAHVLLNEISANDLGRLPSGISLYSLLKSAVDDAHGRNVTILPPHTLVELLLRIGPEDVLALQKGVAKVARKFRYYALNASVGEIPTHKKIFPDGGAMRIMSRLLDLRKEKGILDIYKRCKAERERTNPKHKYIGKYPCERTLDYERRRGRRKLDRVYLERDYRRRGDEELSLFMSSTSWQF